LLSQVGELLADGRQARRLRQGCGKLRGKKCLPHFLSNGINNNGKRGKKTAASAASSCKPLKSSCGKLRQGDLSYGEKARLPRRLLEREAAAWVARSVGHFTNSIRQVR
jgi:hypothetical protein